MRGCLGWRGAQFSLPDGEGGCHHANMRSQLKMTSSFTGRSRWKVGVGGSELTACAKNILQFFGTSVRALHLSGVVYLPDVGVCGASFTRADDGTPTGAYVTGVTCAHAGEW